MLRLTLVFAVWLASTAYAVEELNEAELHEAYERAWSSAGDHDRRLLDRAQRAWNLYRAANCELLGEACYAMMAQERAAELRHIGRVVLGSSECALVPREAPVMVSGEAAAVADRH